MKITFLGTKGYIDTKSKRHHLHTSTLFTYQKTRLLIDCGEEWKEKVSKIPFDFLLITHAHPDHSFGLSSAISQPIYATKTTWKILKKNHIVVKNPKTISLKKSCKLGSFIVEAFPVIHSIKCPAIGYRITAGKFTIFYIPDVAYIPHPKSVLKNVQLYIGDGATVYQNMIRKSKDTQEIFGHATVRQQLHWCYKYKVPKMIITHCGSFIVQHEAKAKKMINTYAKQKNIQIEIAYDGMKKILEP